MSPKRRPRPRPAPAADALYRSLVEHSSDAIVLLDGAGIITYASPSLSTVTGYDPGELIGMSAFALVHPDDRPGAEAQFQHVLQRPGGSARDEVRFKQKDGSWRHIEGHAVNRLRERGVGAVVLNIRDVTERHVAASGMQGALSLLQATFESTADGLLVVDRQGRVAAYNHRFAQMWQLPDSVLSTRDDGELLQYALAQLKDPEAFRRKVRELYSRPEAESFDVIEFHDGRVFERQTQPQRLGSEVIGRVWSFRDVTVRRRAEAALRASEERYRAFISQSSEGIWRCELEHPIPVGLPEDLQVDQLYANGFVAECNDVMARQMGLATAPEVVGVRLSDLFDRADPQNEGVLRAFIRSGYRLTDLESHRRDRQGQPRVFLNNIVGLIEHGLLVRAWGSRRDITERKRAERVQTATYRISEAANTVANLDELFVSIHGIVADLMPARNFYVALLDAPHHVLTFPYYVDEIDTNFEPKPLGKGLTEYVLRTEEPLLATPDVYERLLRAGEVELVGAPSIDWLGVPLRGAEHTFGALVVQTYEEGVRYGEEEKRILQFVSTQVAQAIERKRADEALRQAEERYRSFIEQSTEGVFRIEHDGGVPVNLPEDAQIDALYATGHIAECNDAMAHMYGLARARELIGRRLTELHDMSDPVNRDVMRTMIRNGYRLVDAESHERDVTGRIHYFLNNSVGFVEDGRLVRVWGTQREVTERRRLEDQLRQAQKMEAVGRLAGGIAHDFNNILTAILGTTQLILRDLPDAYPDLRADVEEIRKAATRAADLTRQLLAYSRRQVLAPKVLDLNAVVSGLNGMLRRLIGEDVRLDTALDAALPAVKADPGQLEQVLLNLAVNARDAMPRGGTLTIGTAPGALAAGALAPGVPEQSGRFVVLSVTDTGTGMTAETRAHLFEPFYTTKEVGKGTGLGLATVYGVVKQSGGYIAVDSELGHGTSIRIYLPAVAEAVTPAEPAAPPHRQWRGTETLLLVEDEEGVRNFARRALEDTGYHVLQASSGAEALDVARAYQGPIHLLLTDVVMPGLSGRELAERLVGERPAVRVLYTSGYTDDETVRHGVRESEAAFLQKPFTPEDLGRRIREVLDGG